MKLKLLESSVNLSDKKIGGLKLYSYQEKAVTTILSNQKGIFIISADTGMGKTAIAVIATLLGNWTKTLAIYPTNELIRNQKQSIEQLLAKCKAQEGSVEEVYHQRILRYLEEEEGIYSKPQALINILKGKMGEKYRFILTNPDTLHLILQLKYGSKRFKSKSPEWVLNAISDYRTIVIDEFHYYKDRMLNNLLVDLCVAISLGIFDRIILMTATPNKTIYKYLSKISNYESNSQTNMPLFFIEQESEDEIKKEKSKVATYDIDLEVQIGEWDNLERIVLKTKELEGSLKKEKYNNECVPLCIIVNSVIQARKIASEIKEDFIITEMHGLVPQSLRKVTEETQIIVGTNAIELGIDFDTKRLIFEADSAASFLQRLGRVARRRPSKAWCFVPLYVYNYLNNRITKSTINKRLFASLVKEAFIEQKDIYIHSIFSAYEAKKCLNDIKSDIEFSKVAKDIFDIKRFEDFFQYVFGDFKDAICKIESLYPKIQQKKDEITMFRGGEPQVLVYDKLAERQGFFPLYFSPVSRVIYRVEKLLMIKKEEEIFSFLSTVKKKFSKAEYSEVFNNIEVDLKLMEKREEKKIMLVLTGYLTRRRRIDFRYVDRIFLDKPIVEINKYLCGVYDLELSTTNHLIAQLSEIFENKLFTVLPLRYTNKLDWQLPSFRVNSIENQNQGKIFFGADTLIALAYFHVQKEKE
ncbi:MAG: type I-D CRISPR-associated helicase Cas3' [Candidatus Heimdallarchaeaceae archaeon]